LSPYLFAVYIDTVLEKVRLSAGGCHMKWHCVSILMYADDILLLAPSVSSLQNLLTLCEIELLNIDMCLNVRKSVCTRIGPRYKQTCRNLVNNEKLYGLTPFVTWAFSLSCTVASAVHSIMQRNPFTVPSTLCLGK